MMPLGTIVISILLVTTCRRSSSLILPNFSRLPKTPQSRLLAIKSESGIYFSDDPDCPEEDECKIDWSAMPGFEDDDDDDEKKEETSNQKESNSAERHLIGQEIDELEPQKAWEEPDCPEEDECEIDWSAMPGFEDEDDSEQAVESSTEKEIVNIEHHLIGDETDELEPQEAYVRQVEQTVDKARTILEMNWQIENCIVDEDSCTDFCAECAGSGKTWCNFCRGTGMIAFGKDFRPCILCVEGRVECSACSGTGKISSWAKTHDRR